MLKRDVINGIQSDVIVIFTFAFDNCQNCYHCVVHVSHEILSHHKSHIDVAEHSNAEHSFVYCCFCFESYSLQCFCFELRYCHMHDEQPASVVKKKRKTKTKTKIREKTITTTIT